MATKAGVPWAAGLPWARFWRNWRRRRVLDGVALNETGGDLFLVAQTWCALSESAEARRLCAPRSQNNVEIYRIWDATEDLARELFKMPYSGLAAC